MKAHVKIAVVITETFGEEAVIRTIDAEVTEDGEEAVAEAVVEAVNRVLVRIDEIKHKDVR